MCICDDEKLMVHFQKYKYPVLSSLFVKKIIFYSLSNLGTFVKNQLNILVSVFHSINLLVYAYAITPPPQLEYL